MVCVLLVVTSPPPCPTLASRRPYTAEHVHKQHKQQALPQGQQLPRRLRCLQMGWSSCQKQQRRQCRQQAQQQQHSQHCTSLRACRQVQQRRHKHADGCCSSSRFKCNSASRFWAQQQQLLPAEEMWPVVEGVPAVLQPLLPVRRQHCSSRLLLPMALTMAWL